MLAKSMACENRGTMHGHGMSLREICSRGLRLERQLQTVRARIRAKMDLASGFLAERVSTVAFVEGLVEINREIPGYQDHVQDGFPGFSDQEIARWQIPGLVREALQVAGDDPETRARTNERLRTSGLLP